MNLLDILIAVSFYLVLSLVVSVFGAYIQLYVGNHIKKLQMKAMIKNAPDVEDTRATTIAKKTTKKSTK